MMNNIFKTYAASSGNAWKATYALLQLLRGHGDHPSAYVSPSQQLPPPTGDNCKALCKRTLATLGRIVVQVEMGASLHREIVSTWQK
jgi:hypothetical protein